MLTFALSVPGAQVVFLTEPSRTLSSLSVTIYDIIATSCAYVLSLWHARLLPPHASWDSKRHLRSLKFLKVHEPNGFSSRSTGRYPLISTTKSGPLPGLDIAQQVAHRTQESEQNQWRHWNFLKFCLVSPHVSPEAKLKNSSFPQHNLLIIHCALTLARAFAAATCFVRPRAPPQVLQKFYGARANWSLITL